MTRAALYDALARHLAQCRDPQCVKPFGLGHAPAPEPPEEGEDHANEG